jgi:hypothetical protein
MNTKYLNIRLSEEEYSEVERLKERLQNQMGKTVRVTTKTVFLEALKQLQAYYDKLDRDKRRER